MVKKGESATIYCMFCSINSVPLKNQFVKSDTKEVKVVRPLMKGLEGTYLHSINYGCNNCGHFGVSLGDMTDGNVLIETFEPCELCESSNITELISVPRIDRFDERFPMYDKGLGTWLQSKKHRSEVCKQRGLVPLDSDFDIGPEMSKIREKHRKEDAKFEAYKDKVENAPEFASLRKAQAEGKIAKKKTTEKI
tara:strand:+ start:233 stop:814 length:582 start_codon:yes stop_codon:yes gene_type:complete